MIDNSKNYSQVLPKCVRVYENVRKLKIPIIRYSEDLENRKLTSLRNHFKCPEKFRQCFETFGNFKDFAIHLQDYHLRQQFYCFYCKPNVKTPNDIEIKDLMDAKTLAKHMIEVHRHRRYQCNLCLYRAISAEHVNIHHKKIHSDIYQSTIHSKQLAGKSCKILECPPVTPESAGKLIPSAVDFYRNHKHLRLNNNEIHNNNYQCVYCNFMNENRPLVVDHCVQTHPDYLILFYIPEPLVSSTRSPQRQPQYQDMDMFGDSEPQDNSVTSTEPEPVREYVKTAKQCKLYVEENAFTKKPRVSTVQSHKQPSGLSNKNLNKNSFNPSPSRRYPIPPKHAVPPLSSKIWRPNQTQNKSKAMPKSVREKYLLTLKSQFAPKPGYISGDDSDENRPKKVRKLTTSATNTALPALISPQKEKIDRRMVCQVCDEYENELKESTISYHVYNKHDMKPIANTIPYMCGYCKNFFNIESTAPILAHQRDVCRKRPEYAEIGLIEKLIIPRDEYYMKKLNDKPIRKRSKTPEKSAKKVAKKPRLCHLSDDEQEELEPKRARTDNSHKFDDLRRLHRNKLEKQSSTERDSNRLKKNSETKQNKKSKPLLDRNDSKSSKGYHSSDDECVSSVPETDDELMRPSTSRITTTIETVYPQSDEERPPKSDEFVCLFCEQTFAERFETVAHLESHLPEINNAIDDYYESKPVRHWFNLFAKNQSSKDVVLFESEEFYEGYEQYKCPICVKIGKLNGLRPKEFKTFWRLRVHFWEHTFWKPVKCLKCTYEDHYLPNCDHLIARHLKVKHYEDINTSKNYWIKSIVGDKFKNFFEPELRRDLEKCGFIQTRRYEPLDKLIEDSLKQISDRHESDLRKKAEKEERKSITLPNLVLEPLPALNYDDEDMISAFLEEFERKTRQKRLNSRKNKNECHSKKPLDFIGIGSSTEEDTDDEQPVVTRKNKPNPFDDSDDERNETISQHFEDSDDDDIEVLEEITSTSQTYDKQKSESSEESYNEESNHSTDKPNNISSEERIELKSEVIPKPNDSTDSSKSEGNLNQSGTDSSETSMNEENKYSPNDTTTVSNSPIKRFRCLICKDEFEHKKQFTDHARADHPGLSIGYEKIN